ncbi:MAG TPA: hypothetical protein DCQ98_16660 [Planctomycetaceae bacterium]|nr:hypothetical protein [Planctomycetaceae bacterium]
MKRSTSTGYPARRSFATAAVRRERSIRRIERLPGMTRQRRCRMMDRGAQRSVRDREFSAGARR